ncbi:MAG TPA: LptF/LptG family permease [Saprospiraceae bacterium]|nr:LptF/LptG family permease [Saprospiraceae bacterium]
MIRIKQLDRMLIKGYVGPFLASFFIALFVLVMQTLWLYIDDIIGKGAGILVIFEFLGYLSVSLIPMALPIGVLLAGVFLFGNLGERHELSSMKSSGISLIRIMIPLMLFAGLIALSSWVCSDFVIPKSNLKFLSRLHDLKRQKPTLSLEEGVFNDDFYGYVIRIEKKGSDGKSITNILIDDHNSSSGNGSKATIVAKTGIMYVTTGNKFLVMELYDGEIYQTPDRPSNNRTSYPFIRTRFDHLTKVFGLEEFNLERTDEDLFKNNQRMQNSRQLRVEIDTIDREISKTISPIFDHVSTWRKVEQLTPSSIDDKSVSSTQKRNLNFEKFRNSLEESFTRRDQLDSLIHNFEHLDSNQISSIAIKARNTLKNQIDRKGGFTENQKSLLKKKAKFSYELYIKYSFGLICFIFIFIGAPLGAIVRKGGYGYPLILCIFVFVCYILLNTFCKRLSESLSLDPNIAAWIPCIVMIPPCLMLTWSAQRDRNIFTDVYLLFSKLFQRKRN